MHVMYVIHVLCMLYRPGTAPIISEVAETYVAVTPYIGQDWLEQYEAVYDRPVENSATGTVIMSKCAAYHVRAIKHSS